MLPDKLLGKQITELDAEVKKAQAELAKISTATTELFQLTKKKSTHQGAVDAAKKDVQEVADQVSKNAPKESFADLKAKIIKAHTTLTAQEKLVATELAAAKKPAKAAVVDPDAWKQSIIDKNGHVADLHIHNAQFQAMLKKILEDKGAGDHGLTMLNNLKTYKHWRVGSERIFGEYKNGKFVFIGYGTHVGTGDKEYDVQLVPSGRTKAMVTKHA